MLDPLGVAKRSSRLTLSPLRILDMTPSVKLLEIQKRSAHPTLTLGDQMETKMC